MRDIQIHKENVSDLKLGGDRVIGLAGWFANELSRARSERAEIELSWADNATYYDARKRIQDSNHQVMINQPSVEIPICGMAVDEIYSKEMELLHSQPKILQTHSVDGSHDEHAQALQDFIDWGIISEWGMTEAITDGPLQACKYGTSIYYIPWVKRLSKTRTYQVKREGPRITTVPLDNFFASPGSHRYMSDYAWVSVSELLTESDLRMRAKLLGWKVEGSRPRFSSSVLRTTQDTIAKSTSKLQDEYTIHHVFANYDIDEDGSVEDLLFSFDEGSGQVLHYNWNPYDSLPFEAMIFAKSDTSIYGKGVPELIKELQKGASDFTTYGLINSILANTRATISGTGGIREERNMIFPGVNLKADDINQVREFRLADVYPSNLVYAQFLLNLAGRRVGLNSFSGPATPSTLGTRTPVGTTLSVLQLANTRFGPAFDSMREAIGRSAFQCLLRYREQFLSGRKDIEKFIISVVGVQKAKKIFEIWREENYAQMIDVQTTAASIADNRQLDKDRAVFLSQELSRYTQDLLQLLGAVTSPQTPEPLRQILISVIGMKAEAAKRLLEAHDIKDIDRFVLSEDVWNQQMDMSQLATPATAPVEAGPPSPPGAPTLG